MASPLPPPHVDNTTSEEADDQLPALQTHSNKLKQSDLMIWSGEEDTDPNQVSVPPAHLLKRFSRPGLNRRRSSAASSRRNSITSSQSHHSGRTYRSCTRNSIDQHLRRTSILEDRKARLADRAAHAEQVRQRAALAKAAPRGSNTEERALAAHQAREKLLAKVAAACAEEVNRAKRVAEENKERKAAEEQRYRQELEEKHADAERRRLEYKRTPRRARTTSMANADEPRPAVVVKKDLTAEVAAVRIQRAWTRHKRRRVITAFGALDLSINRVRQASFEEATALLASEAAINSTRTLLSVLGIDVGQDRDSVQISVRTFLSAFMMLGHAEDVFNKTGQQEQDLIGKAKDLLISFESILAEISSSATLKASPTHVETLHQSHAAYLAAFSAWKAADASIIITTMVDQFVALDEIWQTVKDDNRGDVPNEYRDGIRNQQIILMSKIKKLAGADRSKVLIQRAIVESRRRRQRRLPTGDIRPRPVAESNDPSTSSTSPGMQHQIPGGDIWEPPSESSGSKNFEASELERVFSFIPPNRILVHELMIDPEYKIEPSPNSEIRSAIYRGACDNMRKGVANGQGELWTVAVATNVRGRLLSLLKPSNPMYILISETLDPGLIKQQCQHGQFSYDKFFVFMADLLPKLCAPVRDPEVNALADALRSPVGDTDAMIDKLFGILHVTDRLKLDYTNYLVAQQAQFLINQGNGYEQRAFQADFEQNHVSLSRTTRWWRNASLNTITEFSAHERSLSRARPSFATIYARGLVDLAAGLGPIRETDLPETLALDASRLARFRAEIMRFTIAGGILSTAKNLLKRDVRSQWKADARRIFDSLKNAETDPEITQEDLAARVLAIIESGHGMPQASRSVLANMITRFLTEAKAQQVNDPVLKLLRTRLKAHLFEGLAAQSSTEKVRVASTISERLGGLGLGEFTAQVGLLAAELGKVAMVDQAAHGTWLKHIAEESEALSDATEG